MSFAHVAFPLPVFHPYTYRVPESLADQVIPGARVVVPVRRQEVVGVVTATGVPGPAAEARDILVAPDPIPAVTAPLLETARWMAGYYGAPLGLCLRAMLPPGFWGRSTVTLRLTEAPATIGGVAGELLVQAEQLAGS